MGRGHVTFRAQPPDIAKTLDGEKKQATESRSKPWKVLWCFGEKKREQTADQSPGWFFGALKKRQHRADQSHGWSFGALENKQQRADQSSLQFFGALKKREQTADQSPGWFFGALKLLNSAQRMTGVLDRVRQNDVAVEV